MLGKCFHDPQPQQGVCFRLVHFLIRQDISTATGFEDTVGTIPLEDAGSSSAGDIVVPVWSGTIFDIANNKLDVVL